MKRITALGAALVMSTVLININQPAQASVKWDGSVVEVVNKLPKDWPVGAAVNWIDGYTASDIRLVKRCSGTARRCVTFKVGRIRGKAGNPTGWSSGSTITIDVWKTKHVSPYKGRFGYKTKLYVLAHELGHQRYLQHVSKRSCKNVMNPNFRCGGHAPYLRLTAAQKAKLAKY